MITLLVLGLTAGCGEEHYATESFTRVEAERAKLINGIESYQSIEEFKGFLRSHSIEWEVVGEYRPDFKGWRPPFNEYSIVIRNYSHLGFTGELYIGFFNDRLSGTSFYPVEFEEYLEALKKVMGIQFDDNHEARIPPYTRVFVGRDYKGRKYVDWSDIRLDKQIRDWIGRYA